MMRRTGREKTVIKKYNDAHEERDYSITSMMIHYRWAIGAIIFLFCVALQLSGSSIGMWNEYVPDGSVDTEPIIIGQDRPIRSDEWCVFTPMAMSQYYNDFDYESDITRGTNTDVYMVYGQSVRDPSVVFRPFQIGYLFLSPARGLSFYWCGKLIVLFLVSFEFGMLLTERKGMLSLVYAFMVAFAPVVQWWFSVNAFPDMLVYGQSLVLCLSGYLESERLGKKILYAVGISWLSCCYLLVMYPAWQIPFFYIFLAIGIAITLEKIPNVKRKILRDIPLLMIAVMLTAICMILIVKRSWDAISLVINSVYPGQRFETGGNGIIGLFMYVANIAFPFSDENVPVNTCHMADFYDMFPLGMMMAIPLISKKRDAKLYAILAVTLVIGTYSLIGFPAWLSRITFLSKSPTYRSVVALSYCNLLILIRALSIWQGEKKRATNGGQRISTIICGVGIVSVMTSFLAYKILYEDYYTLRIGILCTATLMVSEICIINGKRVSCILICVICVVMGATVNPLRMGLSDIYTNSLGMAIEENAASDKDAKWMVVSDTWQIGDYPIIFGAKTVNCTNTYMNTELWDILDPEGKFEGIYNRYAHVMVEISEEPEIDVTVLFDDQIKLRINADRLPEIGVEYIVSNQNLNEKTGEKVSFDRMFTQKQGDYSIYHVETVTK